MLFLLGTTWVFIVIFGFFGIFMMGGTGGRLRAHWEKTNGNAWITFMLPYLCLCAMWMYLAIRWWPRISG